MLGGGGMGCPLIKKSEGPAFSLKGIKVSRPDDRPQDSYKFSKLVQMGFVPSKPFAILLARSLHTGVGAGEGGGSAGTS